MAVATRLIMFSLEAAKLSHRAN